ncbi:MAG: cytochrome b/b6 domain-containing protein [Anaerolineae bacterium]
MSKSKASFISKTRLNWTVDLTLLLVFVPLFFEDATGRSNHQIIGVVFGAGILYHVLLHWKWVVSVTKRFFKRQPKQTRINYILNMLMLIDLILCIGTGLVISSWFFSKSDFSSEQRYYDWYGVHDTTSWVLLALIGAHLWMHRKWIVSVGRKYMGPRLATGRDLIGSAFAYYRERSAVKNSAKLS